MGTDSRQGSHGFHHRFWCMGVALAAPPTRHRHLRVHASFPMDDQNHFACGAVHIGDDFVKECADNPFLQAHTGLRLRYACDRGWLDNGEERCIAFGGIPVDEAISKEVLQVVEPSAGEAAVLASEEEARPQDDVLEALRRDLEAARYAAQRAQRQYDAADPQNRLVTGSLEWPVGWLRTPPS